MDREFIVFRKEKFIYIEYINGERARSIVNSNKFEKIDRAYTLTKNELGIIKKTLIPYTFSNEIEVSPSYYYKKSLEYMRDANRECYRSYLDNLQKKVGPLTPEGLGKLSSKKNGIRGIYVIHNHKKEKYYVGQAKKLYVRAIMHFRENRGNNLVYNDYTSGDKFTIYLIPLEKTNCSSLNELEDIAIRAYEAFTLGYNKVPGNILDKPIFKSAEYLEVAELIVNRIKDTQWFAEISNDNKRIKYTRHFLKEWDLPQDLHFVHTFPKMIKVYQKKKKKFPKN
ncbi:hypothetical protein [Alkalibacterium sp. 20]|uniref:hypothetical protein n=1 Tax=Alkalibacterium sp. 20 TaxID=1798803 RepID=UPI0009104B6F|nr:hypothetical protein [Alkalibacterium sp. 20]OJF96199.1 hypothetical protein AX762_05555 [Alkalibacterium sp. 20]